jgi:hypothetical protein
LAVLQTVTKYLLLCQPPVIERKNQLATKLFCVVEIFVYSSSTDIYGFQNTGISLVFRNLANLTEISGFSEHRDLPRILEYWLIQVV